MNTLQTDIKPVLIQIKESLLNWLTGQVASIYYLPDNSNDVDLNCYYFLIILDRDPENFDLEFWMDYYKNIEIYWDKFWTEQIGMEKVPVLSINFRSIQNSKTRGSIEFLTGESPELLYMSGISDIVRQDSGPTHHGNPECEMIWI